jgi:hypothetical protein
MGRLCFECPEVKNKIVDSLRIYADDASGREIQVIFADGSELAIDIEFETKATAKHYLPHAGELEILHEHSELFAREKSPNPLVE